jgi:type II secretory pathway component PulM
LHRAQQRLERSRAAVAAAEATLREVQARRAAGPATGQD